MTIIDTEQTEIEEISWITSNSTNTSLNENLTMDFYTEFFLSCTFATIILLTIFGNLLVLLAVKFTSNICSASKIFRTSLAFADLLLGLCVLPFSSLWHLTYKQLIFRSKFCDIWVALNVLFFTVSFITHCMICVDQYFVITRSLTYSNFFTYTKAKSACIFTWIVSIAISASPLFDWKGMQPVTFDECLISRQFVYIIFLLIFLFYLSSISIFIPYFSIDESTVQQNKVLGLRVKIIKTTDFETSQVSKIRLRTAAHHVLTAAVPRRIYGNMKNMKMTAAKLHRNQAKFKRPKNFAKIFSIVLGAFFCCWSPLFIILPYRILYSQCHSVDFFFDIFLWLGYYNSCLNPIIYGCLSKTFRQAFEYVIQCGRSRSGHDFQSCRTDINKFTLKKARRIILVKNSLHQSSKNSTEMTSFDTNKSPPFIESQNPHDSVSSCRTKCNNFDDELSASYPRIDDHTTACLVEHVSSAIETDLGTESDFNMIETSEV